MSLNDSLIISYERQLISKLNMDIDWQNTNKSEIFLSLLNNLGVSKNIVIYFLNKLLPKIINFNDICVKYFQILTDVFKTEMNKIQMNNMMLITSLNALSNFIKIFSKKQEKYNEKHKSIIKQFPQFIQLIFKLFQQKYDNLNKKVIESFLILFLSFIEYYPTLIRNYQHIIDKTIQKIYFNYVIEENDENINMIKITSVVCCNLYKLSPNMVNRYNDYIENIINNIKYYSEFFRPKSIGEEETNKTNIIEEKKNLFFVEKCFDKINNKNIIHANKIMNILFNLLNDIFRYLINNTYFEIDFNLILTFLSDILFSYEVFIDNKSPITIIFNGLSKYNYEFFLLNISEKALDIFIFFISNFSRYIYCFNVFFSKLINKILINQIYFKDFSLHKKIISFFTVVVSYFNDILPEEIDLIIYKNLYNNFPLLYLNYLQINDKTLIQVNELYFSAANVKNQLYNKSDDNKILLIEYLKLLYNYCEVTGKIRKANNKNILSGIIDLIILPPFAKFVFNIDENKKEIIINIIEICVKKNLININKIKFFLFLNNFYLYNGILKYKAECIINLLKIKDVELNNDEYNYNLNNNITLEIFDFNKKIKEYLNNAYKNLENINIINNNKENIKENIEVKEEKEETVMLNKKRKIKKENIIKIDNKNLDERKGNKKKDNYLNKGLKKEIKKSEEMNIEENEVEKNGETEGEKEKEEKNEDIQIDEDIDIPDII